MPEDMNFAGWEEKLPWVKKYKTLIVDASLNSDNYHAFCKQENYYSQVHVAWAMDPKRGAQKPDEAENNFKLKFKMAKANLAAKLLDPIEKFNALVSKLKAQAPNRNDSSLFTNDLRESFIAASKFRDSIQTRRHFRKEDNPEDNAKQKFQDTLDFFTKRYIGDVLNEEKKVLQEHHNKLLDEKDSLDKDFTNTQKLIDDLTKKIKVQADEIKLKIKDLRPKPRIVGSSSPENVMGPPPPPPPPPSLSASNKSGFAKGKPTGGSSALSLLSGGNSAVVSSSNNTGQRKIVISNKVEVKTDTIEDVEAKLLRNAEKLIFIEEQELPSLRQRNSDQKDCYQQLLQKQKELIDLKKNLEKEVAKTQKVKMELEERKERELQARKQAEELRMREEAGVNIAPPPPPPMPPPPVIAVKENSKKKPVVSMQSALAAGLGNLAKKASALSSDPDTKSVEESKKPELDHQEVLRASLFARRAGIKSKKDPEEKARKKAEKAKKERELELQKQKELREQAEHKASIVHKYKAIAQQDLGGSIDPSLQEARRVSIDKIAESTEKLKKETRQMAEAYVASDIQESIATLVVALNEDNKLAELQMIEEEQEYKYTPKGETAEQNFDSNLAVISVKPEYEAVEVAPSGDPESQVNTVSLTTVAQPDEPTNQQVNQPLTKDEEMLQRIKQSEILTHIWQSCMVSDTAICSNDINSISLQNLGFVDQVFFTAIHNKEELTELDEDVISKLLHIRNYAAEQLSEIEKEDYRKRTVYYDSLNYFCIKAVDIVCDNSIPTKEQKCQALVKAAEDSFKNRYYSDEKLEELFKNALLLVSCFVGVGLVIGALRTKSGQGFFFSSGESKRANDFIKMVSNQLTDSNSSPVLAM